MPKNTTSVNIVDEMKTAYGDYALAVLVGRAIPDLYDGMKPVTRRILTAMKWLNLKPEGRFMKSARVDGEVMGKLHPHGGAYGAMVTVAAPYNNNVRYINGHGNWGSPTDNAAASRYTECKLTDFSWDVLLDDFDICETRPNYDGSFQEPIRLETKIPTALLNGVEGIGVGFATKVAPHNLTDICKAVEWVAKGNKKKAAECLIPDFPSGCDILRNDTIKEYAITGKGSMRLRARVEEGKEERQRGGDRVTLTFTHLPFQTNTESIGEQIKRGLEQQKIEGVAEVRDLSDRDGDRLVVVLKAKTEASKVLPYLYSYTDLSTTFSARSLFIDGVRPRELAPHQVVETWLDWRLNRLVVKFTTEKAKKGSRVHILEGLLKAIDKLDLAISIIRKAEDKSEAKANLMSNRSLKLTADQAEAVLEMRLRQLTNLDTVDLETEKSELEKRITELTDLIEEKDSRVAYVVSEVKEIAKVHGWKRRSQIIDHTEEVLEKPGKASPSIRPTRARFIKIDPKLGLVEQLKKPRGANIVTEKERLIFVTDNGMVKKTPCTFKGPLYDTPTQVLQRGVESEVSTRKYLVVFEFEGHLKSMCLSGEDFCRTTSRGKRFIPEDSTLVYIGEGSYTVEFASKRKKPITLTPAKAKDLRPGSKGTKVCNIEDLA